MRYRQVDSGKQHDGTAVNDTFQIENDSSVGSLLSRVESLFDTEVTASVDDTGRIVIDNKTLGESQLELTLASNNNQLMLGSTTGVLDTSREGQDFAQAIQFSVNSATTGTLNLVDSNLLGLQSAQSSISAIDSAVDQLNNESSNMGAITNRLEFAQSNLYSIIQNTEASLSTIRDADFSEEATNLAKSQILTQAGSAMLVQANSLSQNILSLIR